MSADWIGFTGVSGLVNVDATNSNIVTSVTGTTNQIVVTQTLGDCVVSLPSVLVLPGTLAANSSVTIGSGTGLLRTNVGLVGQATPGTDYVQSIGGTANQISILGSGGVLTASLPSVIIAPGDLVVYNGDLVLSAALSGGLLKCGGGGYVQKAIAGTDYLTSGSAVTSLTSPSGRVILSGSVGAVTISLDQAIDATASPTFAGMTVSGLAQNTLVATNVSRALTTNVSGLSPTFTGLTLSGLTPSTLLVSNASKAITSLAVGTTGQFLRGDSTWQDFTATARAAFSAGTNISITSGVIAATGLEPAFASGTGAQYLAGTKTWQDFNTAARAAFSAGSNITITSGVVAATGLEPAFAVGTTAQYRRGDKTWQDFNTAARAAFSAGANITITSGVVAATGLEPTITAGTGAQYFAGTKTWQTLNQSAVAGLTTASTPVFTGLNLSSLTGSRMLLTDGSKNLVSATTGNSITITSTTIDTVQDIRTSAGPQFARVGLGGSRNDAGLYNNIDIQTVASTYGTFDAPRVRTTSAGFDLYGAKEEPGFQWTVPTTNRFVSRHISGGVNLGANAPLTSISLQLVRPVSGNTRYSLWTDDVSVGNTISAANQVLNGVYSSEGIRLGTGQTVLQRYAEGSDSTLNNTTYNGNPPGGTLTTLTITWRIIGKQCFLRIPPFTFNGNNGGYVSIILPAAIHPIGYEIQPIFAWSNGGTTMGYAQLDTALISGSVRLRLAPSIFNMGWAWISNPCGWDRAFTITYQVA